MTRYVAFLRAINVGGRVVKMDRLRDVVSSMGLSDVKTFIASGNVIFSSASKSPAALEKKIAAALEKALGYEVGVFVRSADEVVEIAAHEPFGKSATAQGGSIFICLLDRPLDARGEKAVLAMRTPVDQLHANKREVYWLATKNFQGAQFSPAKMEKALGVSATFRNSTTVKKIAAIVAG